MTKTFLQIFAKYQANEHCARILDRAQNIKVEADKEKRMMRVSADFDRIVSKEDLYYIESEMCKAYSANWAIAAFMINMLPHVFRFLWNLHF